MGRRLSGFACALTLSWLCVAHNLGQAEERKAIRIGFVTFLSGPAAGPFGVSAKLAAEAIVQSLNAGKAPAPYVNKGFGGTPTRRIGCNLPTAFPARTGSSPA